MTFLGGSQTFVVNPIGLPVLAPPMYIQLLSPLTRAVKNKYFGAFKPVL